MKIYYDGNYPEKYKDRVEGFTTNTSFASQSEYSSYIKYIQDYVDMANDYPCSFQICSDEDNEIMEQSKQINAMGKNIFAKIPIIKCDGNNNIEIICELEFYNDKITNNIPVKFNIKLINNF